MIKRFKVPFPAFIFLPIAFIFAASLRCDALPQVKIGLEVLARQHPEMVRGKKLALLTSKTAVDSQLQHCIDRLAKAAEIKVIFTGESFFRETIPSNDGKVKRDALTNAMVVELTDPLSRPTPDSLGDADLLVIDFQDIYVVF